MAIRVAWDRTPSVHGTKAELESLIHHLRETWFPKAFNLLCDRENDEQAVVFLYAPCDPRWISEVINGGQDGRSITKLKL